MLRVAGCGVRVARCGVRGARDEGRVIRFGIVSIWDMGLGTGDLYIKGGRFRDWG